VLAHALFALPGDEEAQRDPHHRDQHEAADELGERERQPMNSHSTIPSSKTRFVEANWNAIAETRLAPFSKSDFAIAIARTSTRRRGAEAGRERDLTQSAAAERALEAGARHPRPHDAGEREAEHQRPPDLPRHAGGVQESVSRSTYPPRVSPNLVRCFEPGS
jgi:hypothetical protein